MSVMVMLRLTPEENTTFCKAYQIECALENGLYVVLYSSTAAFHVSVSNLLGVGKHSKAVLQVQLERSDPASQICSLPLVVFSTYVLGAAICMLILHNNSKLVWFLNVDVVDSLNVIVFWTL